MAKPRDTARYHQKEGNKVVHRGITQRPLEEREQEHQAEFPGSHIVQIGPRVTYDSALEWEREGGKQI